MFYDSFCVIGKVLYSVSAGKFRWYDSEVDKWRDLQGFLGLPNLCTVRHVTLADYGGKWWFCGRKKRLITTALVRRFGVPSLRLKEAKKDVKFWGKLSGLMLCLHPDDPVRNVVISRLLLLLSDERLTMLGLNVCPLMMFVAVQLSCSICWNISFFSYS